MRGSPHRPGRRLPLPPRLRGLERPTPRDAARVSAPFREYGAPRVFRRYPWAEGEAGARGSPREERTPRTPPPHPQGGDGRAAQGQRTPPAAAFDRFRRLAGALGQPLRPLCTRPRFEGRLAGLRRRGHGAPGARQREGRPGLRGPLKGEGPRPAGGGPLRPPPHRPPRDHTKRATPQGVTCPRSNCHPCARSFREGGGRGGGARPCRRPRPLPSPPRRRALRARALFQFPPEGERPEGTGPPSVPPRGREA